MSKNEKIHIPVYTDANGKLQVDENKLKGKGVNAELRGTAKVVVDTIMGYTERMVAGIIKEQGVNGWGARVLTAPIKGFVFGADYFSNLHVELRDHGEEKFRANLVASFQTVGGDGAGAAGWMAGARAGGLATGAFAAGARAAGWAAGATLGTALGPYGTVVGGIAGLAWSVYAYNEKKDWFENSSDSINDKLGNVVRDGYDAFTSKRKEFPTIGKSTSAHSSAQSSFDSKSNSYFNPNDDIGAGTSHTSPHIHTVKAGGEKGWKLAQDYSINYDDMLKVPGNEYLRQYSFKDAFGHNRAYFPAGLNINIPAGYIYNPNNYWHMKSNYGANIEGTFSFLNAYNSGSYKSPNDLLRNIFQPSQDWSRFLHNYSKDDINIHKILRNIEHNRWRSGKYSYNSDTGSFNKQYSSEQSSAGSSSSQRTSSSNAGGYDFGYGHSKGSSHFQNMAAGRQYRDTPSSSSYSSSGSRSSYDGSSRPNSGSGLGVYGSFSNRGGRYGGVGGFKYTLEAPLVIDLFGDGIKLTSLNNSAAFYDIDGEGFRKNMGWPDSYDAFLAVDLERDGIIEQAKEISFKLWDTNAKTDLDGLRLAFDSNKDGKVNADDAKYNDLVVWQDFNENGISEPGEVIDIDMAGIEEIMLDEPADIDSKNEAGGNQIIRAVKMKTNGLIKGNLYDVALAASIAGISYEEDEGEIILHYSDKTKVKVYKVENPEGESVDLRGSDYEVVIGNQGADTITASNRSTVIDGYEGADTLIGSDGPDWLKGGNGPDSFKAGGDHDILLIDAEDDPVNIDGGAGFDIAIASTTDRIDMSLTATNIEAFYGNLGNDIITARGSPVAVTIDGAGGNDNLEGSDHDDLLIGGLGKDKIKAGKGDDTLYIDSEDDLADIDAGEGEDTVYIQGNKGIIVDAQKIHAENIFGTTGDDDISNSGSHNVMLIGNHGKDKLRGGNGNDYLDGGDGDDYMEAGFGNDRYVFSVGSGHDTIFNQNSDQDVDVVILRGGIQRDDLIFTRNSNDLKITFKGNDEDSLTFKDWYQEPDETAKKQGIVNYKIDRFILNPDDSGKYHSLFYRDSGDSDIGVDPEHPVSFITMDGNDKVSGSNLDDFFQLGKGNDQAYGAAGNDTYVYQRGDGKDTITDVRQTIEERKGVERAVRKIWHKGWSRTSGNFDYATDEYYDQHYTYNVVIDHDGGEVDNLVFGTGIKRQDLIFNREGDNLVIGLKEAGKSFKELNDTVTITNGFNPYYNIEKLSFADGSVIDLGQTNLKHSLTIGGSGEPIKWCTRQPGHVDVSSWVDFDGDKKSDLLCNLVEGVYSVLLSNNTNLKLAGITTETHHGSHLPLEGAQAFLRDWCLYTPDAKGKNHNAVHWIRFDDDDKYDVICGNTSGMHHVLLSTGSSLKPATHYTGGQLYVEGKTELLKGWCGIEYLKYVDFNGDGKMDLVCHGEKDGTHYALLSTGHSLRSATPYLGGQLYIEGETAALKEWCGAPNSRWTDFNGDGKADLMCNQEGGTYYALLSTGAALKPATHHDGGQLYIEGEDIKLQGWCTPEWSSWADFDGDSKMDLICSSDRGQYHVLLSTGSALNSPNSIRGGDLTMEGSNTPLENWCARIGTHDSEIRWLDVNGDRKADLVCHTALGEHAILLSTGSALRPYNTDPDGTLYVSGESKPLSGWCVKIGPFAGEIKWIDFNGDGKLDLACDNAVGMHSVLLHQNNADGSFGYIWA